MYLVSTKTLIKMSDAKSLAVHVRPHRGKAIARRDPLGKLDLICLSPAPLYSGQVEFKELRTDTAV